MINQTSLSAKPNQEYAHGVIPFVIDLAIVGKTILAYTKAAA